MARSQPRRTETKSKTKTETLAEAKVRMVDLIVPDGCCSVDIGNGASKVRPGATISIPENAAAPLIKHHGFTAPKTKE